MFQINTLHNAIVLMLVMPLFVLVLPISLLFLGYKQKYYMLVSEECLAWFNEVGLFLASIWELAKSFCMVMDISRSNIACS